MSLVRFSRTATPITDLRNKIRHVYDLHMMLKNDELQSFFLSRNFEQMIVKVGHDDTISYKNNNAWIKEHPALALIFNKPKETWENLSVEYNNNFRDLVTGEFPPEKQLVHTLEKIAERLNDVKWTIR